MSPCCEECCKIKGYRYDVQIDVECSYLYRACLRPSLQSMTVLFVFEMQSGRFEAVVSTLKGWLQACRKFPEIQGSCILSTPSILKYLVFCAEKNLAIGAGSRSSKLPKLAKDKFTSLHRSQSQRESQSLNAFQQIRIPHQTEFTILILSPLHAIYTYL